MKTKRLSLLDHSVSGLQDTSENIQKISNCIQIVDPVLSHSKIDNTQNDKGFDMVDLDCMEFVYEETFPLHSKEIHPSVLNSPKKNRGGSRFNLNDEQITNLIIDHIQNFKGKKSHYSRSDTGRSYLPPGVTINLMYKYCKNETIKKNQKFASFKDKIKNESPNLVIQLNCELQNPDNCFAHTWLEMESGRGPNKVASVLLNFLEIIDNRLQTQDKPPTAKIINEIHHYFPIRGHSYMPPDQVFGQIEKKLRQMETILSLNEYYTVFKEYTTVKSFEKDYTIMDFKFVGKKTVGVSSSYEEDPIRINVLKKQANLESIGSAEKLPNTNHLAQDFYDDIFIGNINNSPKEDCEVYDEDP
ncbi:Uncharacterized protein FWK35_00024480 [Aphis craccivora]|uniref:Uncharacterized protein n=1 Tax=Aphis craccivora TaxID=307492 RepID=A0A6G0YLL6_APHCR|nr:Uncharacterized protein FWK35_00024480 [Aphis craccivora]